MSFAYPRLRRIISEAAVIIALGALVGIVNNIFSPKNIPLVGQWNKTYGVPSAGGEHAATYGNVEINLEQAEHLYEEGVLFLDTRPYEGYEAGHIPGARSVPEDRIDEGVAGFTGMLEHGRKLVTYCQGLECDEAHLLARALREAGFKEVYVFAGGLREWEKAGNPVQR